MNIKLLRFCALATVAVWPTSTFAIDLDAASACFDDIARCLTKDGGDMWGKTLVGKMLFVDPETRQVVANEPDAEGKLAREGKLYVGTLPKDVGIANTALDWAGARWAMIMWPLPENDIDRRILLAHESWHRIQPDLGLPMADGDNGHLDTLAGRLYIQLEWRALADALQADDKARRREAVSDALLFRAVRRAKCDNATANENLLEMNEGLAEYTGIKLGTGNDEQSRQMVVEKLGTRPREFPTFVRSFAYLTGPAYGLLLDTYSPDWRTELKASDNLADLLNRCVESAYGSDLEAVALDRAKKYDGTALLAAETERETKRLEQYAKHEQQYLRGPRIELALTSPRMTFDPRRITPLGEHGSIYGTIKLTDKWGELTATEGCLVGKNWKRAVVALDKFVDTPPLTGAGWQLILTPGWKLVLDKKGESVFILEEEN